MQLSDAQALATGLERLSMWLRHQVPQTVSSSTITALDRLDTEGPLRVSELAEREAMTQPGVTILVNRLAEAGWAERFADPTDRRATLVRITAAGRERLADRNAARARVLRDRIAELSDDDQQLLTAALPALERLIGRPADIPPSARKTRS
jgi:DNA-binding MarR family transcriptional regulator